MSNDTVRRSTFTKESVQGRMKKIPEDWQEKHVNIHMKGNKQLPLMQHGQKKGPILHPFTDIYPQPLQWLVILF